MPVVERAENCEGPAVALLFKVADVPVVQVVMVPHCFCGCQRPCDHTATSSCLFNSRGASDSVHCQNRGHLVVQWRLVRGVMAVVMGPFLTHFASFFALLRLSRS